MKRRSHRGVDRLATFVPVLLPAIVYSLVISSYYQRLRTTLALPDYGDLWRMSVSYSIDGRLHITEPFVEAQPFAHIPIIHAVLNHVAITQTDYSVFWLVGALSAIATGGIVGAGFVSVLPRTERSLVGVLAGALVGVLAFRFDVRHMVSNSLLLESQVLFLQGTLAIAVAGRYAAVRHQRIVTAVVPDTAALSGRSRAWSAIWSSEQGLLALLLALLVVGDAPAGVLSVTMLGLAVTAGILAKRPLSSTFRIFGLVAVSSLAIRWISLQALGARGETGPSGDVDPISAIVNTFKLIGAGIVNLTAVFTGSQETYDRIHLGVAVVVVLLWAVTVLKMLRQLDINPGFAVCVTLAVGFIVVSAAAIAAIRGVGVNHQGSRAVRGTALVAPVTLATIYYALRSFPRLAARASMATLAVAIGLLALRGVAVANSYRHVGDVLRYRERTAVIVCEQPRSLERWDLLWPGFGEESIDDLLASEHLDIARRAGCEEVAAAGGRR